VTKELYKNKVKEFCSLMNVNDLSQKPTAQAIFDRINGRFTDDDMIRAFDDMVESEVSKLTYPTLKRYLTKYKEIRVSADLQRKKSQEKTDVENMMSHAEIKELVDIIIHKKPGTTPAPDFLKTNATIWTKDGRSLDAWIDPNDPNMQPGKAVTIVYEQQGDNMVRTQHIRLGMVKHKILTKIDRPPERKRAQSMFAPKVVEDDFIPELEVDENAFQDSFNMDGRPGGNA
jgi:hypothetical protein